jgi:hypothetical protein
LSVCPLSLVYVTKIVKKPYSEVQLLYLLTFILQECPYARESVCYVVGELPVSVVSILGGRSVAAPEPASLPQPTDKKDDKTKQVVVLTL